MVLTGAGAGTGRLARLLGQGEAFVGGGDPSLGQAQLPPDDVRPPNQRHHLVEGVAAAHSLAPEAAIRRDAEPLGRDGLQGFPEQAGDLLRAFDLEVAVIDDADGDLGFRNLPPDGVDVHTARAGAFEGEHVHVESFMCSRAGS